jgi:hypothetical protein
MGNVVYFHGRKTVSFEKSGGKCCTVKGLTIAVLSSCRICRGLPHHPCMCLWSVLLAENERLVEQRNYALAALTSLYMLLNAVVKAQLTEAGLYMARENILEN